MASTTEIREFEGVSQVTISFSTGGVAEGDRVSRLASRLVGELRSGYHVPILTDTLGPFGFRLNAFADPETAHDLRASAVKWLAELGAD